MAELTVCICTLDRPKDLEANFEALLRNPRVEEVDVLVVNNGPTEESPAVVARFADRLRVRYVRHPKPTVGEALNRAWREAKTEWLAYLDDDSIVYETWVPSILEAIPRLGDDCFAMVGNVDMGPNPPALPEWCHPNLAASAFSNTYFGTESRFLDFPAAALGNNLGIRRSLLERHGGFAMNLRTYWENHMFYLGYGEGKKCFFNSGMHVIHKPSPERISKKWMLNKCRMSGRDYQRMLPLLAGDPRQPPRFDMFLLLPLALLKLAASWLMRNPRRVMAFRGTAIFQLGRLEQLLTKTGSPEYSSFGMK